MVVYIVTDDVDCSIYGYVSEYTFYAKSIWNGGALDLEEFICTVDRVLGW